MIEVYYAPPSIYGRKVLTVLYEKNLDFEIKKMSFEAQDHLKEDYLKLNPNGEIPTMVDDGQVIYESTAIVEYLDEEYPEPPLMPVSSYDRARVRIIEEYCDLHLYRAIVKTLVKLIRKEEVTQEDQKKITDGLQRIETYLGNQEYLVGKFSLADCVFMPVIPSLIGINLGNLLELFQTLRVYGDRLKKRPGFKGASMLSL